MSSSRSRRPNTRPPSGRRPGPGRRHGARRPRPQRRPIRQRLRSPNPPARTRARRIGIGPARTCHGSEGGPHANQAVAGTCQGDGDACGPRSGCDVGPRGESGRLAPGRRWAGRRRRPPPSPSRGQAQGARPHPRSRHEPRQRPDDARADDRAGGTHRVPGVRGRRRPGPRPHPAPWARHPRGQPHLERRPGRRRRLDHRRAQASPDPLAGQAGAVRMAGPRLGGGARRNPPGRPRCRRHRRVPPGHEDPRERLRPARVSRGHPQPHRRAPGREGRRRDARPPDRRPDRADRRQQHGRGVAQGTCAADPVPAPPGHRPHRHPVPPPGRDPRRRQPARGEGPRDDADHGPDRRPAGPPPPGRLCRRRPRGRPPNR